MQGDDGNDLLSGSSGNDTLDDGNGIDQLFGGDGNDQLAFSGPSDTYNDGTGIDTLSIAQNVSFTGFSEKTAGIEMLDLRSGGANTIALNAADILSFDGSTGESVNGRSLDLVVRGDTGGGADTVSLQQTGGAHFTLEASGVGPTDPAYGGASALYDVYGDGAHPVAIEQGASLRRPEAGSSDVDPEMWSDANSADRHGRGCLKAQACSYRHPGPIEEHVITNHRV